MTKEKEEDLTWSYLSPLIGAVVVDIAKDTDDPEYPAETVYGLVLKCKNKPGKTIAWVLKDPEGNGPGFLSLQEE